MAYKSFSAYYRAAYSTIMLPSMVELEKQELEAKRKHYDLMMVDFVSHVSRAIVVRSTLFKI